ncbi:retinoic acid early transcript 1E-like isoform X2 [Saccopteryx leptura]|uniref:retinoic acid early transcript 1E-like isoform X2 n=1 Tax=Saccopteryx leptura TaxID=249018 RepID=UPI00339C6B2E
MMNVTDSHRSWIQRDPGGLGREQGSGRAFQEDLSGTLQSLAGEFLEPMEKVREPTDNHCLCLNLTVLLQSGPRQPWCQAQGSLDEELFLQDDSDSKGVRLLGPLGEKVNGTNALNEIPQTLGEISQEVRMILSDIKLETRTWSPLILRLCCQQEAGRCTGAFVKVIFNGQPAFLFDAIKETWTDINSTAGGTQENWEGIKKLAHYFRKISMGDCNRWLGEFLKYMEKLRSSLHPPCQLDGSLVLSSQGSY